MYVSGFFVFTPRMCGCYWKSCRTIKLSGFVASQEQGAVTGGRGAPNCESRESNALKPQEIGRRQKFRVGGNAQGPAFVTSAQHHASTWSILTRGFTARPNVQGQG